LNQIAAELQGYDPQALRASDVNAVSAALVEPVTADRNGGPCCALDRVLAQDVVSPISVPPHDNSAMDGFAFAARSWRRASPGAARGGHGLAGKAWQGTVAPASA
jgi:molybdopterin molybdotransferase